MARVLVVDQDAGTRSLVHDCLERSGHEVNDAPTGVRAAEILAERPADVVLLGEALPDIEGFDLARRGSDADGVEDVPVVMLTPSDCDRHAAEVEVDGWLSKPFTGAQLETAIHRTLAIRADAA